MSKLKRRRQAASRAAYVRSFEPGHPCPNCGELTVDGHYAPPALGDPGFFICAGTKGGMQDTMVKSVHWVGDSLEITMDSRDPRLARPNPVDSSLEVIGGTVVGMVPINIDSALWTQAERGL